VSQPLASVDEYLAAAGSLDKALLPLGFLLAFCAQHRLLSQDFVGGYAEQLSAVRLQEGRVTTLFAAHGASLYESDFNAAGITFLRNCLPQLSADFAQTFGQDCYDIEDNWVNYQQLANVLVRRLMGSPKHSKQSGGLWASVQEGLKKLWR
jgi:hypothetical protein